MIVSAKYIKILYQGRETAAETGSQVLVAQVVWVLINVNYSKSVG